MERVDEAIRGFIDIIGQFNTNVFTFLVGPSERGCWWTLVEK